MTNTQESSIRLPCEGLAWADAVREGAHAQKGTCLQLLSTVRTVRLPGVPRARWHAPSQTDTVSMATIHAGGIAEWNTKPQSTSSVPQSKSG